MNTRDARLTTERIGLAPRFVVSENGLHLRAETRSAGLFADSANARPEATNRPQLGSKWVANGR